MDIFERIANWISGETKKKKQDKQANLPNENKQDVQPIVSIEKEDSMQEHQEKMHEKGIPSAPIEKKQGNQQEEKKKEQPLDSKDELHRNICDLSERLFADVEMGADKRMVIWVDADVNIFKSYDTEKYRKSIQSALVNECGVTFEDITFHMGKPSEEMRISCTPVGKSGKVMMQIIENRPEKVEVHKKASISIFGNAGCLLKEKYILSSDEMKEKKIQAYNIGAGEFPEIPSGYRHNHIAIDDNPQSPMIEKNKFVSRMHAHIGYSEKFGFYLQVERDGTRLMGKRTRIFRGEHIIEMENLTVKEPLQDGDLIELGKAVRLRYIELKN